MKVLLDIKDEKADFVMEVLHNFSFVKTHPISDNKSKLMKELRESIQEVNLAKQGKIKLKSFDEFLNEI